MTDSEEVAHDLLRRQVERSVAGSNAVILYRNNSDDRLEATTELAEDSPLHQRQTAAVRDSVAQAAPVLANLRSLTLAEFRASTGGLTGLPNQRAVKDTVKRMAAHASRTSSPLSAIMLDLDHFKKINDSFGHGRGDDVLAAAGAVLSETVRKSDFVGRNGGEEFVVALPDTDTEGALVVAEKIRSAIAAITVAGVERDITASLGIATFPQHAEAGDQLIRCADRALYAAKTNGRNRVEVAIATALSEPELRALSA